MTKYWYAPACIGAIYLIGIVGAGCSKSPQEKAARYLEQGKQYLGKHEYDSALLAFRNAAREMPSDAEPHYQSGLAFMQTHAANSAALAFQSAIARDRNHLGARLKLAELMVSSQDKRTVEEGARLAHQVLASNPDNPDAISTTALAEMRSGNETQATEQLKKAMVKNPGHPGIVLNLARSLVVSKDGAGAENVLKDGIAASPKAVDLLLALGDFYLQNNSLEQAEEMYRQAIALEPDRGAALLALATVQSKRGKQPDAERTLTTLSHGADKRYRNSLAAYLIEHGKQDLAKVELERLFKADPGDKETRTALVNAYLGKQEVTKAEAILGPSLTRNAGDPDALLQRGRVYLLKGEFAKAEEDLTQVLRVRADSSEAYFLMSKIHRNRGSLAAVRQELAEAVRLDPKLLVARVELSQLLRESGTGGARTALGLLDGTPPEQKQIAAALLERNWALIELGRAAETRPVIEAILKVSQFPEAVLQKAVVELESKEYAPAKATLEELLAKTPDDARVLQLMLQAYTGSKDTEAGMRRIRKHVAQRAESPGLKAFLGHLLVARGEQAEARAMLEAAAAAAPKLLIAQLDLADLDIAEGKLDNARALLQKLVASDRDGSIHVRLAALHERQGEHANAIEQYRAALGANSANVTALNNLAYLVADREGNADEALKYAQQAKELAPKNPAVDDTLGWTYYRKGLYSLAVRHLESSTAKEKTARRLFHLSMAYSRNGEESKGRVALNAALKMDASMPEAIAAREVLAEMRKTSRGQDR